jgi:predicted sulfurtransferase
MAQCFKCNEIEVPEEFLRCDTCEAEHKRMCAELDSKKAPIVKPVKETLYPIKEMKQGIEVTTWISKEDAMVMGIKV